jgi:lipoyl-dependent peroxiredoxin
VPRVEREAHAVWEGSSAKGRGALTAGSSGAFSGLPFSEPTRVGSPDGETSPEELLAAAHAGCFTMSLAAELTRNRTPPERLEVRAAVVLDEVEEDGERSHRIVGSALAVGARVPGLEVGAFDRIVATADAGCTFSKLIKASGTVEIEASLEEV